MHSKTELRRALQNAGDRRDWEECDRIERELEDPMTIHDPTELDAAGQSLVELPVDVSCLSEFHDLLPEPPPGWSWEPLPVSRTGVRGLRHGTKEVGLVFEEPVGQKYEAYFGRTQIVAPSLYEVGSALIQKALTQAAELDTNDQCAPYSPPAPPSSLAALQARLVRHEAMAEKAEALASAVRTTQLCDLPGVDDLHQSLLPYYQQALELLELIKLLRLEGTNPQKDASVRGTEHDHVTAHELVDGPDGPGIRRSVPFQGVRDLTLGKYELAQLLRPLVRERLDYDGPFDLAVAVICRPGRTAELQRVTFYVSCRKESQG